MDSMRRLRNTTGKAGAFAVAAGVGAGLAAGLWLRLMMRLVALTVAPGPAIIQNADGELLSSSVPVFTVEGSISVIVFPAVMGFFLGLFLFLLRVLWPPFSRWRGTLFGVLLVAVPGVPLLLSTPELRIGPKGFGVALFALTPFVFGWAFELLMRTSERIGRLDVP